MWYRLETGRVVEIFAQQPVFHPTLMTKVLDLPDGGLIGDSWDGSQFVTPEPPSKLEGGEREPTISELTAAGAVAFSYLEMQLEHHIESEVKSRRYRGVNSLGRYQNTPGRFQQEANELSEWVVAIYEIAEDLQDDVLAGSEPLPTWPELLAMLPAAPTRRRPL